MTPKKALEILTLNYKEQGSAMPKDCAVALFMAMSALTQIMALRNQPGPMVYPLLAGETPE